MRRIFYGLFIFGFLFACVGNGEEKNSLPENAEIPYLKGESRMVIDPSPKPGSDENKWYTNDHCFVTDHNNNLHWFGINNPYPPEGKRLYRYHPFTGHLITKNPVKNWERLPFALDESKGSEYLGAPYIIWHEETGRWVMVIQSRFEPVYGLEVCWSDDLNKWERTGKAILYGTLWSSTRDPHIMKGMDGKYWIHLVSGGVNGINEAQIIRIRTKDFNSFEPPEVIMEIKGNRTSVESPFVLERNGAWYLFCTYAHRRYEETIVIVSDNPDNFSYEDNCLTTLFGHASEIFTFNDKTYISSCGPEDNQALNQHGVTLAELGWLKQK
jgi:beta-xylosidase